MGRLGRICPIISHRTSHYKRWGLRWSDVKAVGKKTLSRVIDVEKNYNFWPYSDTAHGVTPLLFILIRVEVSMVLRTDIPFVVFLLLVIVTPTLLPSKLEEKGSVTTYILYTILRQFSFE